ncbi:MAG: zinc metallopeptidase [Rikenellaceae bacterium]
MQFTQTGAFWLMIVVGIAGFAVQARLKSVFAKYSEVPSPNGMSGRQAAEAMLRDNGIHNVRVISTPGQLTDHFDPRNMTVNLSESVYECRSVSAVAVACHECGHAVQHATAYAPLVMRSQLVPMVSFSSRMSTWVIIAGMLMISSGIGELLCWIGIGMIAMTALFSLITLPVEYNASSRALAWMESSGVAHGEQLKQADEALKWAARTYVVAALSAIATLLYYLMMMLGRRRE